MDAAGKFGRQCFINQTLARDPPKPGKGRGDDDDGEMRLAALPCPAGMTSVPGVPGRIVGDVEPDWGEPLRELLPNGVGDTHYRPARSNSAATPRNPARSSTT